MRCTLEATFTLHDDDSGDSIEIGDDLDGIDMLEIRYKDRPKEGINFTEEQVPLLIEALQKWQAFAAERRRGNEG